MQKDLIKQGFDAAEKEHQEQQVKKIKEIVQKHLEQISQHQEKAKEHQEKATLLKKDLDDLKAGRLDRIEERQEKDLKAKEVRIIEIHRIEKEYIPMYPWRSPYYVEWVYRQPSFGPSIVNVQNGSSFTGTTSDVVTVNVLATTAELANTFTGQAFANFTGGTYAINGNSISL